jgi:hypothetical protein
MGVGTFNPMLPNGYYVTPSGYTGCTNFIDYLGVEAR